MAADLLVHCTGAYICCFILYSVYIQCLKEQREAMGTHYAIYLAMRVK